uniref:Putative secreted protein n=1 Tax=Anopheles darlingi TaxID=43151 RepID=A0A2M4DGW0_ANODA
MRIATLHSLCPLTSALRVSLIPHTLCVSEVDKGMMLMMGRPTVYQVTPCVPSSSSTSSWSSYEPRRPCLVAVVVAATAAAAAAAVRDLPRSLLSLLAAG